MITILSSLAELLKSPKKQEENNAFLLFHANFSNPYGHGQKVGTILHLGRADILKGVVTSFCRRAVGRLDLNPSTDNEWYIVDRNEMLTDPKIYRKLCRRCMKVLG
jgi:hypothetical protein